MGTAALADLRESRPKSYVSRGGAAVIALALHGALIYLIADFLGVVRMPQPPTVEPIVTSLVVQPRNLPTAPQTPALSPADLVKAPVYRPPDAPPSLRIEVPIEAPPAQEPTEPQLGDGSPSPRGTTDEPGETPGIAIVRHVPAVYSSAAVKEYEHGTVELRVLVDEKGRASELHLLHSSGFPRLDESAAEAVRQYRFTPPLNGSQPARAWTAVKLEFDLLPMPVPTTIVAFDAAIADQIAAAKRKNDRRDPGLPGADGAIARLAGNLLDALSKSRAAQDAPFHTRASPTPLQLLAAWGKLRSVRFLGHTSREFDSGIPTSDHRPTTGSRLGGADTLRCEIFEVNQVGGTSYWLAVVGNDGTRLKSIEITVATDSNHPLLSAPQP